MKIAYISDYDMKGSGYLSLSIPICAGLTNRGHEVMCIGLGYDGKEHPHEFSIIPTRTLMDAIAIIQNLKQVWKFDVLIVALDIPIQETILKQFQTKEFPYVGIMPIEAPPLCLSWAMVLLQMDKAFIISQFGTDEAQKVGVYHAEYLPLGIDTEQWKPVDKEDKQKVRQALGIEPDEFMILQVADNQERKLLSKAFEVVKLLKEMGNNVKYYLVTREFSQVGWRLRDLAQFFGINNEVSILERGMPFEELKMLYAAADCFLLTSKAEGLGLPLMEAMSMKIPCVATDCAGMKELLKDGRGILVGEDNKIIDPFGNGYRWHINASQAADLIDNLILQKNFDTNPAREYVEQRKWSITIDNLERALKKIAEDENGKKEA
jgi:glycosyltransferase involved in cell wall biosynthesis